MTGPVMEVQLTQPVNIDGVAYDKLAVASLDAIARFNTAGPERVLLSMSRVFGVPRRVIRHLTNEDTQRAGDLIVQFLNDAARASRQFEI
ncbi:hypothetical protein [Tardiphaga robiniae]|uniref:Phage tail assembly protein n=1 Tax=Tardiphaga robiniae TaxID=943830 RepID=A0A7G6TVI4_9BRAD|nr:hypothetical protein [Tardiphaga robiniae]QND70766.1 hypothetical protein HB776_05600 [Tardiphaga robiniae]